MARLNGGLLAAVVAMGLLAPAGAQAADGKQVYTEICGFCHDDGTVGAPIKGDKAAWAPRLAKGKEALYDNTLTGLGHMLPRQNRRGHGTKEIKEAIDYLTEQSR